jgi:DNA-binding NarL/FixJ family response regulator
MPDPIRVALIEDQRATREGLTQLINGSGGFFVAGRYASGEEALKRIAADRPDVILTDIGLPGMSGIEVIAAILEILPNTPILILTVHGEDEHVCDALRLGACGYLLKDVPPARLLEALREVHAGGAPMSPEIARRVLKMFQKFAPAGSPQTVLSPRELQVIQLLAEGHSYKGCAEQLSISLDTVRFHVRQIYDHLHVHSKSEAVRKAMKHGWIL